MVHWILNKLLNLWFIRLLICHTLLNFLFSYISSRAAIKSCAINWREKKLIFSTKTTIHRICAWKQFGPLPFLALANWREERNNKTWKIFWKCYFPLKRDRYMKIWWVISNWHSVTSLLIKTITNLGEKLETFHKKKSGYTPAYMEHIWVAPK